MTAFDAEDEPRGELIPRDLNGHVVQQRRADGYVNATALCKAAGKKWANYWQNASTREFVAELVTVAGIPATLLVQIRQGGSAGEQGTWVHPDVAVNLAQWLSPKFAVAVSRWVRELLTTGRVEIRKTAEPALDPIIAQAELIKEMRIRQLAAEREAAEAKRVADQAEKTARAALCQSENNFGYFQILGFARRIGLELTEAQASAHGRAVAARCRERGVPVRQQAHQRYGFVNLYPESVPREGEILGWVDAIATDIGRELDAAWTAYCLETSRLWNARVRGSGPPLTGDGLVDRVGGLVRAEIAAAAASAAGAGRRPALGTTIQTVGRSAVLLLPVLTAGPAGLAVGVPVFVLLAARPVWEYVAARLDDRRGDYRAAISARLAVLGNRVGAEFEREVRGRIADLHQWQERSVRATAARLADERAGGYL